MLFFELQVNCTPEANLAASPGEERRSREEWLANINDVLNEGLAGKAELLFIDRVLPNGFHLCAALNPTKAMTAGQLTKRIAPLLFESCGAKDVAVRRLREVTREQFVHYFEACEKKRYTNFFNPLYEMNLDYADNRTFQLAEGRMRGRRCSSPPPISTSPPCSLPHQAVPPWAFPSRRRLPSPDNRKEKTYNRYI